MTTTIAGAVARAVLVGALLLGGLGARWLLDISLQPEWETLDEKS